MGHKADRKKVPKCMYELFTKSCKTDEQTNKQKQREKRKRETNEEMRLQKQLQDVDKYAGRDAMSNHIMSNPNGTKIFVQFSFSLKIIFNNNNNKMFISLSLQAFLKWKYFE